MGMIKVCFKKKCAVLLAFMCEQGLCSYMNSLEPGSHMLAKKTAYLFDTDFNTHLLAKNEKKLMMKSRENALKPVFPAYFRHFLPKKKVFRKSGSVTFLGLPFCTFVPKIRNN